PLMPDGSRIVSVSLSGDLVLDLGDIGTDDIEDAFNSDANQPFTIVGDKFVQAVQNSENKLWQWIGGDGAFGNSATLAEATDFVDLTSSTPPPNGNPNLQEVTDSGNTTTNDIQVPDVHSDQNTETKWFRINKDYLSIGDFGDGAGNPYGGSWSKFLSIFAPNGYTNGIDMYAQSGDNFASFYVDADSRSGELAVGDATDRAGYSVNNSKISITERTASLDTTLSIEPPSVNNHVYK